MSTDQPIPDGWVLAEWAGPSPVLLSRERRVLAPGDTALVPATEADESDNWRPVGAAAKPGKAAPAAEEVPDK